MMSILRDLVDELPIKTRYLTAGEVRKCEILHLSITILCEEFKRGESHLVVFFLHVPKEHPEFDEILERHPEIVLKDEDSRPIENDQLSQIGESRTFIAVFENIFLDPPYTLGIIVPGRNDA